MRKETIENKKGSEGKQKKNEETEKRKKEELEKTRQEESKKRKEDGERLRKQAQFAQVTKSLPHAQTFSQLRQLQKTF